MGKPKESGQRQPEQGPALPSDGPLGMAFVLVQHLDPDTLNAIERVQTSGKRCPILLTVTDSGRTA